MTFKAVTLPKSLDDPVKWDQLIERYKAFRLDALDKSPEAFGSSYAREVAFSPETWASRLNNPIALNTVVLSGSESETDETSLILNSPWLAALTLVGPLEATTAAKNYEEKMHLDPDTVDFGPPAPGVEWTYVLNAMYVPPSERRKGLATMIIEHAKRLAVELNDGKKVTLALILDAKNVPAMGSYEKAGFKVVHSYWFDDLRWGEPRKTNAAVMRVDVGSGDV